MARADSIDTTPRRDFLFLAAAACTTVMATRQAPASATDDSAVLAMEEEYFQQKELATPTMTKSSGSGISGTPKASGSMRPRLPGSAL